MRGRSCLQGMNSPSTRPLLILDLDETLLHASENRLGRDAEFKVGPYHVYLRPHLPEFLDDAAAYFDLAVWSSASDDYVGFLAKELSRFVPNWRFVWGRSRCVRRLHSEWQETVFLKDLKKVKRLGYRLSRVLIADDTPHKVSRNYGNAIYVQPYLGINHADCELQQLSRYVASLRLERDFRKIEKRGWRSKK